MAIPDPPKAGSPFCALWTGGWNPKTPKINNFFIPEITLRGGYDLQPCRDARGSLVRGDRWPVARLRFDIHVMARFLTRNSAGSTVLTWVWITKLLKISPFPVHG